MLPEDLPVHRVRRFPVAVVSAQDSQESDSSI